MIDPRNTNSYTTPLMQALYGQYRQPWAYNPLDPVLQSMTDPAIDPKEIYGHSGGFESVTDGAGQAQSAQDGKSSDLGPGVSRGHEVTGAKEQAENDASKGFVSDIAQSVLGAALGVGPSLGGLLGTVGNYASAASAPSRNVTPGAVGIGKFGSNIAATALGMAVNPALGVAMGLLGPTAISQLAESLGFGTKTTPEKISAIGVGPVRGYSTSGKWGISAGYMGDIAAREKAIDNAFADAAKAAGGGNGKSSNDSGVTCRISSDHSILEGGPPVDVDAIFLPKCRRGHVAQA